MSFNIIDYTYSLRKINPLQLLYLDNIKFASFFEQIIVSRWIQSENNTDFRVKESATNH